MKIYRTTDGILIEEGRKLYLFHEDWDHFINDDDLYNHCLERINLSSPLKTTMHCGILIPAVGQEIWGAGVTYMRSREARMDEAKDAGGGDFYDRVYDAERPELFFKSAAYRAVGTYQKVRIRHDSKWNVPEPELTLMISSSGKILGYTLGNDMSSRDIEGENPLYLPQAKTYDGSAAVGPCILVQEEVLASDSVIDLHILRNGNTVVSESISIDKIKRKFTDLVSFLFRETSFPNGCLLMTGTGIVPPPSFTLRSGDVIRISSEAIGILENVVE